MGESVSLQVPIDRYPIRRQVLLEEPIQRGLQRRIEARDRSPLALLAIAASRATSRRLRDAQGDRTRDGVVSIADDHTAVNNGR